MAARALNLKQVDRSLLVELKDGAPVEGEKESEATPHCSSKWAVGRAVPALRSVDLGGTPVGGLAAPAPPTGPTPIQAEEGVRACGRRFRIRKSFRGDVFAERRRSSRTLPTFDEHRFGFHSFLTPSGPPNVLDCSGSSETGKEF
jgi:hypothetical protein